jgi:hypothetical protein
MEEEKKATQKEAPTLFDSALISLDTLPSRRRGKDLSPLAALFPRQGSTEIVLGLGDKIQSRLFEIESAEESADGKSAEEGMLRQIFSWLNRGEETFENEVPVFRAFNGEELIGIYELARLYYETGFLTAAERVLNGLVRIDEGATPSRGALGVVNLESAKAEEAVLQFRASVKSPKRIDDILVGKLGLIAAFLSVGDVERAGTLVSESEADLNQLVNEARASSVLAQRTEELRELWQAFALRCGVRGG